MAVKAYKCVVDLTVHEVTSPGVRLANKHNIYLRVTLLDQQRRTSHVPGIFPLKFNDRLMFEKTFRYCRDPIDVVNSLSDSNVLIELVQVGHLRYDQVLAFYETTANDFLYPISDVKSANNDAQRDVFLSRTGAFPGSISPQMIFCMTINIIETQTPSLDILRQYESRVQTPAGRTPYQTNIDVETHVVRRAKIRKPKHNATTKKSASHRAAVPTRGILKHGGFLSPSQENFTNHTISSAIKADYTIPDVKFKLDELNTSVKKTRKIKNSPAIQKQIKAKSANASTKPFVVRKVEDSLILRKPELHDVLHDGLILTKKNPKHVHYPTRRRSSSLPRRSRSFTTTSDYDRNAYSATNYGVEIPVRHEHTYRSRERIRFDDPVYSRTTRSLSPPPHRLGNSLNENLALENQRIFENIRSRSQSRSRSASPSRSPSRSPSAKAYPTFRYDLSDERVRSISPSNCEVCSDYETRKKHQQQQRVDHIKKIKQHQTSNTNAIFHRISPSNSNSPPSNDHLNENNAYVDNSFQEADTRSRVITHNLVRKISSYPKNKSFSYYAPPPFETNDWAYERYYPWLNNYVDYLANLEDELYWLKLRSKYLKEY